MALEGKQTRYNCDYYMTHRSARSTHDRLQEIRFKYSHVARLLFGGECVLNRKYD